MQLKNRPHANSAALAPFAHFLGLPSASTDRSSASRSNAQHLQERLAPVARFFDVASSALSAVDGRLLSGSSAKRHELPTASTTRPRALKDKAQKPQIISRRVAPGVTVQSSVLNDFPPEAPVRASKPISKMAAAKASGTPFSDAMRGYTAPIIPEAMTTHAAGLTDRQKTTATYADAQAASQRLDTLRKKLSDAVWDATLAGKRANPAELSRLHGQIERAEATAKATMREAMEAQQCALARKSSAVRAALTFPEQE